MPPNRTRRCSSPPDFLSNLPDDAIDNILGRLFFQDVVRTSILSKIWRYYWHRFPHVKFGNKLWKTTEDLMSPTIGFTSIVYHLLALHTGPITKFTLNISHLESCPNIDPLLYFLSGHGIQHIHLHISFHSRYILPCSFFGCSGLRHLLISGCLISPPPEFQGFYLLITLELRRVIISSKSLGSLISHCPLLESLRLFNLQNSDPLEINAPKLRSFFFSGNVHCIHLKNVPLLSNVTLKPKKFSEKARHDIAGILECIPALESFCCDYSIVLVKPGGPATVMPPMLPSTLNFLKHLKLSGITLGEFLELSFVLCLIRSSPNLEEIEIKGNVKYGVDFAVPDDVIDEIPLSFLDMTFNHLRTVEFYDVTVGEAELELIRVLLAKSPALVRMVIKPCEMEDAESSKVLSHISEFQRASSDVRVCVSVD